MPRPTWRQVAQFCEVQQFERDVGDHIRYIKRLPDGSSAGTMISHGETAETVSVRLWKQVWSEQLRLMSEDEFWRGLDGASVRYDISSQSEPVEELPAYLRRFLRDVLYYPEEQIAATDRETAQALFDAYHSQELND